MKYPFLALVAMLVSACENSVQTTSGADYLAGYQSAPAGAQTARPARRIDPMIAAAAAVEPTLTLPARFAIGRVERTRWNCSVGDIPKSELTSWREVIADRKHLGEFTVVDPQVATLARTSVGYDRDRLFGCMEVAIEDIRLGAARKHADAVLIYSAVAEATRSFTPLAVADLTIIGGAFLPTRSIETVARADAMLVDVRTGYVYATAEAEVTPDMSLSTTWNSDETTEAARLDAVNDAIRALIPNVDKMIAELAIAMAAKQAHASPKAEGATASALPPLWPLRRKR